MLAAMGVTAYRIVTERLVIRCYEPSDAPMVRDTVTANLMGFNQAWIFLTDVLRDGTPRG